MLNFVKGIFCIYWDDHVIFVLYSVYALNYINQFAYIETSLHPWNEIKLIVTDHIFNMLVKWICRHVIEKFCDYVHQRNCCNFFFWSCSYPVLISQQYWLYRMSLVVFPSILFYRIVWGALISVFCRGLIESSTEFIWEKYWAFFLGDSLLLF
jgi:hypothetical protein